MPEHHDLLTEALIRVRGRSGEVNKASLPDVLSALQRGDAQDFPGLRPHQQHAWHAFLVQLAGLAGIDQEPAVPLEAEQWRQRILQLTGDRHEPWCLVVDDLALPAFLQPPVPEGSLKSFGDPIAQPDDLDMLVTAKNHDLKRSRMDGRDPEAWIFALITLQTMDGYPGRGNYGIARMNGGLSNRPALAVTPALDIATRFNRDLAAMLQARPGVIRSHGYPERGGKALVWLEPWDGHSSLPLASCDPFFIEICRRVRIERIGPALVARPKPTEASRIEAKLAGGDTGDPWTPVSVQDEKAKALTVDGSGFSYRRTHELLFSGTWKPGAAQIMTSGEGGAWFTAWALTRGQGKTEGLHERILPIPAGVRRRLMTIEGRQNIGEIAKKRVAAVGEATNKVLKPALLKLLQDAHEDLNFKDKRPQVWLDRFDDAVDGIFFDCLWQALDLAAEEADRRWAERLVSLAREHLDEAIRALPVPAARRYRAIALSEQVFAGAARKRFPQAFAIKEDIAAHES